MSGWPTDIEWALLVFCIVLSLLIFVGVFASVGGRRR